jgi:hypothetical protein
MEISAMRTGAKTTSRSGFLRHTAMIAILGPLLLLAACAPEPPPPPAPTPVAPAPARVPPARG